MPWSNPFRNRNKAKAKKYVGSGELPSRNLPKVDPRFVIRQRPSQPSPLDGSLLCRSVSFLLCCLLFPICDLCAVGRFRQTYSKQRCSSMGQVYIRAARWTRAHRTSPVVMHADFRIREKAGVRLRCRGDTHSFFSIFSFGG